MRGITDTRSRGPQVPRAGAAVVGSRAGKADGLRPGPAGVCRPAGNCSGQRAWVGALLPTSLWLGPGHALTSLGVPAGRQEDKEAGVSPELGESSLTLRPQMDPTPCEQLALVVVGGAGGQVPRAWGRLVQAPFLWTVTWTEGLQAGQEAGGPQLIVLDRPSSIRLRFIPGASFQ